MKERQAWCYLQVKLCDPCLSALSVPPWPKKRYINTLPFLFYVSPHQVTTIESSSFRSFSMEQKHGPLPDNLQGIWMRLTSGVCGIYYTFPGGPHFYKRGPPPLTYIIRTTHLKFFDHNAHADPSMNHSRALRGSVTPLPRDWNHRLGRRHHT